jgi:hypothetical protein
MRDSSYCWNHDPSFKEQRRSTAARGGRTGGRGRPSTELVRLQARFEELAAGVLDGSVDRGDGAVVCQLLNGARSCVRDRIAAREQEELAARLEQVETALDERKRGYAGA